MEAGSSKLALLHYSSLHACLAAYTNILRRDLNTTCITSNCDEWRHGSWTNQGSSDEYGGFLKQAFSKSRDKKPHERWLVLVKYCDLLD